ncbi:nucleic acid-binding protein [Laetiporus sulphureus 93-53]|uniref:Nucleic acid-binding protein n=1 Tax=Laetiporus sulphureus 93-53 TaxID=1314785 RepID=A0A165HPR8_9APHY|nr:nucleic acid-binding protein [Laetiporus sulphureus 93-53]KZT12021.1 nucleic acid-binding protein [Laetiporus sulphureus 93-53]
MASLTTITKLPVSLRNLVEQSVSDGSKDFGKDEKDKTLVAEWIEKIVEGEIVKPQTLKDLDRQLTPRTYLVSNYYTVADTALYGALHPVYSQFQPAQYYSFPSLTRYFDHIQSRPQVRHAASTLAPAFSVVTFDLENAPHLERKPDAPKKKDKAPAPSSDATPTAVAGKSTKTKDAPVAAEKNAEAAATEAKVPKKEKKEKKPTEAAEGGKKKAAGGGNKADEGSGEPVPSMIDLRVGHIVDIKKHPDADGLYVEQIDFGEEEGPRTVVSGLVHYIPIEQMRDKYLVGVCNLKPANMRGVKSFAMVLCATSKDGKEGGIELIQPPPNSKPGERVYFEGPDFENATPLPQLNPKKKIFETVQPGFVTLETREAAWVNPVTKSVHRVRTKDGLCVAPTLVGASLS